MDLEILPMQLSQPQDWENNQNLLARVPTTYLTQDTVWLLLLQQVRDKQSDLVCLSLIQMVTCLYVWNQLLLT